jgi:hypothetical protein
MFSIDTNPVLEISKIYKKKFLIEIHTCSNMYILDLHSAHIKPMDTTQRI